MTAQNMLSTSTNEEKAQKIQLCNMVTLSTNKKINKLLLHCLLFKKNNHVFTMVFFCIFYQTCFIRGGFYFEDEDVWGRVQLLITEFLCKLWATRHSLFSPNSFPTSGLNCRNSIYGCLRRFISVIQKVQMLSS